MVVGRKIVHLMRNCAGRKEIFSKDARQRLASTVSGKQKDRISILKNCLILFTLFLIDFKFALNYLTVEFRICNATFQLPFTFL